MTNRLQPRNERIVFLYSHGKGVKEIAELYKVSRQRIDQVLRKCGADMRQRKPALLVSFICKECGKEKIKRYSATFCDRTCLRLWKSKHKKVYTVEEKREQYRTRIRAYRATPHGYERFMVAKRKFESTDKYREWYKRYYGHYPGEGPGVRPRNTAGVCIVTGCGVNREMNGLTNKGVQRWHQTCYKHKLDGTLKSAYLR